jgi:hypothetical protein
MLAGPIVVNKMMENLFTKASGDFFSADRRHAEGGIGPARARPRLLVEKLTSANG